MNHFAYPQMFWLLLLPFVFRAILPAVRGLHGDALRVPFLKDIERINIKAGGVWNTTAPTIKKSPLNKIVLFLIWALLVTAVARPLWVGKPVRLPAMSRDILLVVDISTSMLEQDFVLGNNRVDRLTAVKKTATDFIRKRVDDRIGLVLFGSLAYVQAPITYDKKSVEEILLATDAGMAGNSTSIGDAIGASLKSLRSSSNLDKKVIILLTDGENNSGRLSLAQAIKLAKDENVKIYTIGVGAEKSLINSIFGINLSMPSGLDEESLAQIAKETEGSYFRAKNTQSLEKIYAEIDKLEANENEAKFVRDVQERFYIPLSAALLLSLFLFFWQRRRG